MSPGADAAALGPAETTWPRRIRPHLLGSALVLALCLSIFPGIFRDYFFRLEDSDQMWHVAIARAQLREGRPTAPHHLYHSLLIGVAKADGSTRIRPAHAWWLNIGIATLSCLATYAFLAWASASPASYRAAALLALLAVSSAFLWELNALSAWFESTGRWALGYIRFNSFHSPTLNLLRPLALLLFTAVLTIFARLSRVQWGIAAAAIAALAVISTMAKPNYIIALLPAVALVACLRRIRLGPGHVRWGLFVVLVVATAWILEHQRNFVFKDEQRLHVGFQLFGVYVRWGLADGWLPVRYLLSALFPVVVYLAYFESARRSPKIGRSSSIKSSASDGRPGRSWWRKPTYGSSPTTSRAEVTSLASSVYKKESSEFMLSNGGRRERSLKKNASRCWSIRWLKTLK